MAAEIFQFDKTKSPMAEAAAAMRGLRDHWERLKNARAAMNFHCAGDTGVAANWPLLATACAFQAGGYADANTAAQASFAEIDTLYAQLAACEAALSQCCGKHGV